MTNHLDHLTVGQARYQAWRDRLLADPESRAIYAEAAAKKELWLQLVEARQSAGLTQAEVARRLGVSQAQVSRIEKRGYDAYTLTTLRRYVETLGEEFSLRVSVVGRTAGASEGDPLTLTSEEDAIAGAVVERMGD